MSGVILAELPTSSAFSSVTTGLPILLNRSCIRAVTSAASPIWVKVPRPSSAARVIK